VFDLRSESNTSNKSHLGASLGTDFSIIAEARTTRERARGG
jgi:hypothetical protein